MSETIRFRFEGPVEIHGVAFGARTHDIQVSPDAIGVVDVRCADGSVATIKPGKRKVFCSRGDNALHLLDCTCPACLPLGQNGADTPPQEAPPECSND